jgi:hypothetical protein
MRHMNPATVLTLLFLDTAFTAAVAWMMWWNAGVTVADLSGPTIAITVLIGGTVMTLRQLLAVRPRYGLADVRSVTSERVIVWTHVAMTIGLAAAWKLSGLYLLGWFTTFAFVTLLVANVIQLLTDLAARAMGGPGRRSMTAPGRNGQVEVFHAIAAAIGLGGLFATVDVHAWSPGILNLSVVLAAATLIAGGLAASALRRRPVNAV